jgi:hypothetical protein
MRIGLPVTVAALLLAWGCGLSAGAARGQSGDEPASAPDAAGAWGSSIAPAIDPRSWVRPATQPHREALLQATPTGGSLGMIPATPVGIADYQQAQSPSRPDAVYLDELQPPAPPQVQPVGLTEQTVPPMSQMLPQPVVQGQLPPGARNGIFQKVYGNATWIPAMSNEPDALGFGDLDTGVVFGFPMLRRDTPLLVTPQFGVHFLENAAAFDLPTELFDSAVEFRHLRMLGGGPWGIDVAATVGYYSDFDQSSDDALRVTGRGIAAYEASPTAKWVIGAAYVNRAGASLLPIAGVIYVPQPEMRWELVFPKPRIAWQTAGSSDGDERWLYVGGEFGGGVWSVTRPSTGDLDLVDYSDWRLLVGWERKVTGGFDSRLEFGYAFKRELGFDSPTPDVALDDSVFLRAGLTY